MSAAYRNAKPASNKEFGDERLGNQISIKHANDNDYDGHYEDEEVEEHNQSQKAKRKLRRERDHRERKLKDERRAARENKRSFYNE